MVVFLGRVLKQDYESEIVCTVHGPIGLTTWDTRGFIKVVKEHDFDTYEIISTKNFPRMFVGEYYKGYLITKVEVLEDGQINYYLDMILRTEIDPTAEKAMEIANKIISEKERIYQSKFDRQATHIRELQRRLDESNNVIKELCEKRWYQFWRKRDKK